MIRTGDKIKVLNENAEGIVKKILGHKSALVQIGDFEYEFPVDHLIKVNQDDLSHPTVKDQEEKIFHQIIPILKEAEKDLKRDKIKKTGSKKEKRSSIREIDLHSHEIIEDRNKVSNSRILDYQLNYFIRELEKAIAGKEKSLIFIHGKGEGILKAEIHKILNSYSNIVFYDAPFRFYGGGATQVEIH